MNCIWFQLPFSALKNTWMLASHAAWKRFRDFFFFFKASAHRWNQQTNVLLMCFLIPLKFAGRSRQRFAQAPNNLTSLVWVHLLNAFSECLEDPLLRTHQCKWMCASAWKESSAWMLPQEIFFFFFLSFLAWILSSTKRKKEKNPVLGGHYTAGSQRTSLFLTLIKSLRCQSDCIWSLWR